MARIEDREKALVLRKKGESISTIAKTLRASKSTVSFWCKDIKLSASQVLHLQQKSKHAGRAKLLSLNEKKRFERLLRNKNQNLHGANRVGSISERDLFMLGLGLYWGEGYKTSNSEFGFTNSDPKMIQVYLRWLLECFNIKKEDLILRVSINHIYKDQDHETKLYWSKVTKVPLNYFTKTSFIKSKNKKVYGENNKYYGTLRIKVRRGLKFKNQVLGAIQSLSN